MKPDVKLTFRTNDIVEVVIGKKRFEYCVIGCPNENSVFAMELKSLRSMTTKVDAPFENIFIRRMEKSNTVER